MTTELFEEPVEAEREQVVKTDLGKELEAFISLAKRFPRNEMESSRRIREACKWEALAGHALYALPKNGQLVTAPSIRLTEAMARGWGNIRFGRDEISQTSKETTMRAYAQDLEQIIGMELTFKVPHGFANNATERYSIAANLGSRRVRACILAILPAEVIEEAVGECERLLAGDVSRPFAERVSELWEDFGKVKVTIPMLAKRLGHPLCEITEEEISGLRKIHRAIQDNVATKEDFFGVVEDKPEFD